MWISLSSFLSISDRERLHGYLEGTGKIILPEPQALLAPHSKMPGLDGQKMSKSYHNTIAIREEPASVEQKIRTMPTDPARVRRIDPGDPEKCPVWAFHRIYSNEETKAWVMQGCTTAGIGCLECKKKVSDEIIEEQKPIIEKAQEYKSNTRLLKEIIREGNESAREMAKSTLEEIRDAMGLPNRDR